MVHRYNYFLAGAPTFAYIHFVILHIHYPFCSHTNTQHTRAHSTLFIFLRFAFRNLNAYKIQWIWIIVHTHTAYRHTHWNMLFYKIMISAYFMKCFKMSLTYFNHNFPLTLHHHHLCRCRLCHRTRSLNVKLIGTDGDTMASSCWHWNKNAPFVFLPTKQKPCVERFGFAFPISHSHLVVSTSDKCYSYCIHPLPQHTHTHIRTFSARKPKP